MLLRLKKIHLAVLLSALFSLLGFTSSNALAEDNQEYWVYQVKPNDTVWGVSHDLMIDWRLWEDIVKLNNIEDSRALRPQSFLKFPRKYVAERPANIKVLEVTGAAEQQLNGERAVLTEGYELLAGSLIRTEQDSTVYIEFEDKTKVLLLPNSELRLHTASMIGNNANIINIKVELEFGEVEIDANPNKTTGSYFVIETPSAHATTRGTKYRVRENDATMTTEVIVGKVGVANTAGQIIVKAGYGSITKKGQKPAPPKKLLGAPNLPDYNDAITTLPSMLSWPIIAQAKEYRIQVSKTADFNSVLLDRSSQSPSISLPISLQDNTYYLRVSGIDSDGLQGKETVKTFTIDARPFAPLLNAPLSKTRLYPGAVEFSWVQSEVDRFALEIARDKNFTDIIYVNDGVSSEHEVHDLNAGTYFWRVASIDADGKQGLPSQAEAITVEKIAGAVEILPVKPTNDSFKFSWIGKADIASYEIQLSDDEEFSHIIESKQLIETDVNLTKPTKSGHYFVRLRGIDVYGHPGEWSSLQRLDYKVAFETTNTWKISHAALLLLLLAL